MDPYLLFKHNFLEFRHSDPPLKIFLHFQQEKCHLAKKKNQFYQDN